MARTGFRIDTTKARAKIARARGQLTADQFRPELADFSRKSLATAARITPVRDYATIRRNQSVQYNHRVNFIPSFHELIDPSLRINGNKHHIYFGGKWYRAEWKMPASAWSAYQALLGEHLRRKATARPEFIAGRAQARFLYRKSWGQVGASLGLSVPQSANVAGSHSRHEPPKEPPKGYGQWRGGKVVLSVVIYNPFLEEHSDYKDFTGKEIIQTAMQKHEAQFKRRFASKLKVILYAIFHQ